MAGHARCIGLHKQERVESCLESVSLLSITRPTQTNRFIQFLPFAEPTMLPAVPVASPDANVLETAHPAHDAVSGTSHVTTSTTATSRLHSSPLT